jgi:hypothetical protein
MRRFPPKRTAGAAVQEAFRQLLPLALSLWDTTEDVEPLLRAAATIELDAQMPVTALADAIEALT